MENIDYMILYTFSLLSTLLMYMGYSYISNRKFKFTFKNIVCLFISALLFLINGNFNFIVSKAIITILLFSLEVKILFNDNIRSTIIFVLTFYLTLVFFDFVFSFIFYGINTITASDLSKNQFIVGIFTLLVTLITSLFCKTKNVRKISNKLISLSQNSYFNIVIIFLTIFFIIILSTKLSLDYNYQKYFFDVILLLILLSFLVFAFIKNQLAQKEKQEKETLLEFISKYEKIIDENRINKHEMLNNLIILKSFKNKNSKEYNKVLDDLIVTYDNNSDACVKNISNLPTGLKGILYYKVNDMRKKGINLNINISKRVSSPLEKLPADEYVILSKILGIVMDNALEASLKSEQKIIMIEVFEENGNVIITIENTYANKVNIDDLKKKNYSTKGKGRGLGLYIANMLLKKSKHIEMEQHVNDTFTTRITIK